MRITRNGNVVPRPGAKKAKIILEDTTAAEDPADPPTGKSPRPQFALGGDLPEKLPKLPDAQGNIIFKNQFC